MLLALAIGAVGGAVFAWFRMRGLELTLDIVLGEMIARARELKLRAVGRRKQLVIDLAILLAARSAEFAYRRRDWHAL